MAAPTIVTSILTGGSNNHATSAEEVNAFATDFATEGVVGTITNTSGVAPMTGAFAVNASATPDANINISTGVAYVTATPTSQNSQLLRIKCSVTGTLAISANSSGSTKYDWIYISVSAANAANPNSAGDNVATIVASRSSSASTDDGTPPTYGYPIAVVTVANGFTTITNGNIRDVRANSNVTLGSSGSSSGWIDLGYTPNTITNNGNRSYDLVFNSTDLTSTVSKGMRLKATRIVTAPTQCTDLEASSSQYFSRASASLTGMTFTDDFVVSAWVKLESYGGATQVIASRHTADTGWLFALESDGRVRLQGSNTAAANYSRVTSYQSLPLNKWVHVTAQLDMSAFTATTTTSYVMIDGVDIPAVVARAGTNPTALVQGGNLEIGSYNGGAAPFDGKIAQVAIYSAKVTQATIRGSMSQTLSGSETSLISAYSFNNTINDLNATNGNNLTANGSAVATNADTPFAGGATGTTEYGIITGATFSTNTTLTVQVPEGSAIPTSGGVSAVSYSTQKVPYGFPAQRGKWSVEYLGKADFTQSSPVQNTWYNLTPTSGTSGGLILNIPTGDWIPSYQCVAYTANTTTQPNWYVTLSTANNSESDSSMTTSSQVGAASSNYIVGGAFREKKTGLALSSATNYYLNIRTTVASAGSINIRGSVDAAITITAELAYL